MFTLKFIITVIFATYIPVTNAVYVTMFPIGGLFNRENLQSTSTSFSKRINTSKTNTYRGRSLMSKVVDSYSTSLELCDFTQDDQGITALIDARPTGGICDTICLLCNRLQIPHLALGWEPTSSADSDKFTFFYHPPPEMISKAFAALIKYLAWDKFSIMYEDDGSFIRLQEVINTWSNKANPILFKKLKPGDDNLETFKYVFKVARISYHIIDCDLANIRHYMNQIVHVENSTEYQSFILTNLDAYTLDFEDIPSLMANVSTLHLTTLAEDSWRDIGMDPTKEKFRLETALAVDALTHLEMSIRSMPLEDSERLHPPPPPALCLKESTSDYDESIWPLGSRLQESLTANTIPTGFTGPIAFENGKRVNFSLHYSKLNKASKFVWAGGWDYLTNEIKEDDKIAVRSTATSSKIRVVSVRGPPYFQEVKTSNGTEMRGYAVDLIDAIFEYLTKEMKETFEYEFYTVEGGAGNKIAGTNKWNGILGELLDHRAHLGISDLTITSERNAVVDFSVPFMTLGISLLYREPEPPLANKWSFIKPLALDVWLYLATAYIIVSFILLICSRMCQGDWVNPHPCNKNPENLENIWSFYNCLWLSMGTIMTQGCDILPRAPGSRWIAGMWWFFAMIVTASYTANMSTFLSNDRRSNEIKSVEDLLKQNKISYGAVVNGSTYKFFKNSNDSIYSKIWVNMESAKPTVFLKDNAAGVDRVARSKGNFAFFMESTTIEYYVKRNCNLTMLGSKLDSKEYGIAMAKNYPKKNQVDYAILKLQEIGVLEKLKKKWWEEEDNAVDCKDEQTTDAEKGLQMDNTSGIFLVLGTGGILGFLVAVAEFLLHAREICAKEKVTFKEALLSEWRASLNPRQLHKPAAPPRSAPPSTASPSPLRERSNSRAVSVLKAAQSFINFDEIY